MLTIKREPENVKRKRAANKQQRKVCEFTMAGFIHMDNNCKEIQCTNCENEYKCYINNFGDCGI